MCNTFQTIVAIFVLALLGSSATVFAQAPTIVSTSPAQNELNVSVNTNISVTFDIDMDSTTINDSTFVVNARSTGLHTGIIAYDSLTKTATLDPSEDFDVGEVVTVVLTTGIQSSQGIPLGSSYIWSFTIVVNGGTGTFVVSSAYPVGDFPTSIFAADLDDDGDLDLATANWWGVNANNVSVMLNNGNGIFAPHTVYPVGLLPFSVFAADLDGDGDLDLTTANSSSSSCNVSVLLNNGNGTFASHSVYPIGDTPSGIFAADLDGDGDLDLVIGNWSSEVFVIMNNGNATFGPPSSYPCGVAGDELIAADLDGDGDLDLAIPDSDAVDGYRVSVTLNNGDGTFGPYALYPVGSFPRSVFAADLDGDGDLDLATANRHSDNVSILLNNGDGTFAPHSDYPVGIGPLRVFAADLDGDGDLDLAITSFEMVPVVSVLLNNGDGTFAPYSVYPVNNPPLSLFAADLDGDGDIDLAITNALSDSVSILLNQGTVICGDINNDGKGPDVDDLTYLVDYLFFSGPPPPVMEAANVDGEGGINVADLTYLVEYLFFDGPALDCQPIQ